MLGALFGGDGGGAGSGRGSGRGGGRRASQRSNSAGRGSARGGDTREVCQYFLDGSCRFGDQCRFSHHVSGRGRGGGSKLAQLQVPHHQQRPHQHQQQQQQQQQQQRLVRGSGFVFGPAAAAAAADAAAAPGRKRRSRDVVGDGSMPVGGAGSVYTDGDEASRRRKSARLAAARGSDFGTDAAPFYGANAAHHKKDLLNPFADNLFEHLGALVHTSLVRMASHHVRVAGDVQPGFEVGALVPCGNTIMALGAEPGGAGTTSVLRLVPRGLALHESQWARVSPVPAELRGFSGSYVSGGVASSADSAAAGGASSSRVLVFGGMEGGVPTAELRVFDPALEAWGQFVPPRNGTLPAPRAHHAAAVVQQSLLVHGGVGSAGALDDTWRFDTAAGGGLWVRCATRGGPARSHHAAALYRTYLVIFGGTSGGTVFNDLWALHLGTLQWVQVQPANPAAPAPLPRVGHGMAVIGDEVVVVGGFNPQLDRPTADVWAFSLVNRVWRQVAVGGEGFPAALHGSLCLVPSSLSLNGDADPEAAVRAAFGTEDGPKTAVLYLAVHHDDGLLVLALQENAVPNAVQPVPSAARG